MLLRRRYLLHLVSNSLYIVFGDIFNLMNEIPQLIKQIKSTFKVEDFVSDGSVSVSGETKAVDKLVICLVNIF